MFQTLLGSSHTVALLKPAMQFKMFQTLLGSSHTGKHATNVHLGDLFQTLLGSSHTLPEPPLLVLILRYLCLKFLLT